MAETNKQTKQNKEYNTMTGKSNFNQKTCLQGLKEHANLYCQVWKKRIKTCCKKCIHKMHHLYFMVVAICAKAYKRP